jgi:hypothetical protein
MEEIASVLGEQSIATKELSQGVGMIAQGSNRRPRAQTMSSKP